MNHKISRKIISCILAVVMLFGVASVAAVAAADDYDYPVIVINGIDNNPLYANPNAVTAAQIFPPSDLATTAYLAEMYIAAIVSIASNEYEEPMNYFVGSQLFEVLEKIQLNPDGTSKSANIGPITYEYPLSYYYTDTERYETIAGEIGIGMVDRLGAENVYVFTYDWRIDPIENAKNLHDFIQNVKYMSGKDKVSIISEGYGSTVAVTYLAECYDDATADVDNFVTVNSAFMGTSLIGDIYTGRLASNYNDLQGTTSAVIRWINDFSDNPATAFASWLVMYVLNKNWEIQDGVASVITMMGHITDDLYDNYLRDMLKNFVGLWALVPVDYYEEAIDWMFMDDDAAGYYNSQLQEKIQTFKNYQYSASEILNKAKSEGININVISCWDLQLIPLGDEDSSDDLLLEDYSIGNYSGSNTETIGLSAQSDGFIDTYYSSFGAYTVALNDVGAAAQNGEQRNTTYAECENHSHVNAVYDTLNPEQSLSAIAHYIDASTCALPDNTWFIRNMKHGTFDTESNSMDFIEYLVTCDATMDVFSADGLYNQFMYYNRYINPGYLQIPDYSNLKGAYLLGDVNLDKQITAADARLALRISAGLEDMPSEDSAVFQNADVNGDNVITAADARIILRVTAGLSSFKDFEYTSDVDNSNE